MEKMTFCGELVKDAGHFYFVLILFLIIKDFFDF